MSLIKCTPPPPGFKTSLVARIIEPDTRTHNYFFDPCRKHPVSPRPLHNPSIAVSMEPGCYIITCVLPNVQSWDHIMVSIHATCQLRILADTLLDGGGHFERIIEFPEDANTFDAWSVFENEVLTVTAWKFGKQPARA
jgi:HSP20 family molecular chaperone IbpA